MYIPVATSTADERNATREVSGQAQGTMTQRTKACIKKTLHYAYN
jgi:hypothetical protein